MRSLIQSAKSYLADKAPLTAAYVRRVLSGGPAFRREGSLWLIQDGSGRIFVPYIRRYGMYGRSIKRRVDDMLARYQLGDLKNALVLDIGAHIGEFAMAAAPLAKQVLCFEPDPAARAALLENTKGLSNVRVFPMALSHESRITKFFVATAHADSSLFEPEKYSQVIEVEARRLDSLGIDAAGYTRVVLKMDAEGFEPEVLQGAGDWLRNLNAASVDVAPERAGADTYSQVKEILTAAGMREVIFTADQVLVMRRE